MAFQSPHSAAGRFRPDGHVKDDCLVVDRRAALVVDLRRVDRRAFLAAVQPAAVASGRVVPTGDPFDSSRVGQPLPILVRRAVDGLLASID